MPSHLYVLNIGIILGTIEGFYKYKKTAVIISREANTCSKFAKRISHTNSTLFRNLIGNNPSSISEFNLVNNLEENLVWMITMNV